MTDLCTIGKQARTASYALARLTEDEKNAALELVSKALISHKSEIIEANKQDLEHATLIDMSDGLKDRLRLTDERITSMADALLDITKLHDPIGEVLSKDILPNGVELIKKRVPIGVIGIIYEARPNVTSDAFSLCFKSGNAVILKGGSDAINSNAAITEIIRSALHDAGIDENCMQLIMATDHETTDRFMRMNEYVDVLIPRGSKRLIQAVLNNATVPVIETGAGNCHTYIDCAADKDMAVSIIYNAKTSRIGTCNTCESLVVHRDALNTILVPVVKKLQEKSVICYADEESEKVLREASELDQELIKSASDDDFYTEYLDYKISIKTVSDVNEAIEHINSHSTKHSECIVTEDNSNAETFLNNIDSACVYWNASTRLTDGGCFGFGAEIGISTSKLHARGPMGLKELTTSKYTIIGNGQIR